MCEVVQQQMRCYSECAIFQAKALSSAVYYFSTFCMPLWCAVVTKPLGTVTTCLASLQLPRICSVSSLPVIYHATVASSTATRFKPLVEAHSSTEEGNAR